MNYGWKPREGNFRLEKKSEFSPDDQPNVTYLSVHLACMGATYKVSCTREQFNELEEGRDYTVRVEQQDGFGGKQKFTLISFRLVDASAAGATEQQPDASAPPARGGLLRRAAA